MIEAFLTDIFLAVIVLSGTFAAGAPYIFLFLKRGRFFTKLLLSFVTGYILIALVGILSEIVGIDPFYPELLVILAGLILIVKYRDIFRADFSSSHSLSSSSSSSSFLPIDRYDKVVLGLMAFYAVILIAYFAHIIMWMAGDAVGHASIIRLLIDGELIPISLPPFGSYWEYYPKAFHLYSYLWAKGFGVLPVIQTIPVLITAITPGLLYSVIREFVSNNKCESKFEFKSLLKSEQKPDSQVEAKSKSEPKFEYDRRTLALFAFVFACFCFPQHYMYLIWAGYPSATAEMLLVAAILAALIDRRLLLLILPGMLFTHSRFLVYLAVILVCWFILESVKTHISPLKIKHSTYISLGVGFFLVIAGFIFFEVLPFHEPRFLLSIITDNDIALEYVARWFWALISVFGIVIALYKRDKPALLALGWTIGLIGLLFSVDTGIINIKVRPDRILSKFYLPFALFAGFTLAGLQESFKKLRKPFLFVLILMGLCLMGGILYTYSNSWALPKEDYNAMIWLEEEQYDNGLCLNLDGTGGWTYPISGVKTAITVYHDPPQDSDNSSWGSVVNSLRKNPTSSETLVKLNENSALYSPILIFISNTTLSKPNYQPPFSFYYGNRYQLMNMNYSSSLFQKIYTNNSLIIKYNVTILSNSSAQY